LHSLGGRDTTSYLFHIGKKAWITKAKAIETSAIEAIGESTTTVMPILLKESK